MDRNGVGTEDAKLGGGRTGLRQESDEDGR